LLYIFGLEYTVGLGKELARRVFGYQRDDLRAFFLGEAWPPTGAGTVAESVHPCEIEPVEALSDGLWMTAELLGDLEGTQSLPTQRDDTGSQDLSLVACRLLAGLWTLALPRHLVTSEYGVASAQSSPSPFGGSDVRLCIPPLKNGAMQGYLL
jgi:hypothetical protein